MMKAALTALALGAGVFFISPPTASAAPLGLQGATAPANSTVEKVHGRRHGHHYRHRHWNHGHHYYYRPYRHHHHHWRRHYQAGPYFGFSFGPSWGYGTQPYYQRRWH